MTTTATFLRSTHLKKATAAFARLLRSTDETNLRIVWSGNVITLAATIVRDNRLRLLDHSWAMAIRFDDVIVSPSMDQREVAVNARDFDAAVSSFSTGKRDITLTRTDDGTGVVLDAVPGLSRTCRATSTADLPPLPSSLTPLRTAVVSAFHLSSMIRAVKASRSTAPSRFGITGYNLELGRSPLTLVTTDGRRLSIAYGPMLNAIDDGAPPTQRVSRIVPHYVIDNLAPLLRLCCTDHDDCVTIEDGSDRVCFRFTTPFGTITITSSCMEGAFPPWRDVIPVPSSLPIHVRVNRTALLDALTAAIPLIHENEDETPGARFVFTSSAVTITAIKHQERGSVTCPITAIDGVKGGKNYTIGINPRFLRDAIDPIPDEMVTLDFPPSANKPIYIESQDKSYAHVLMPIISE